MNIQEAKDEIRNTLLAYHKKDKNGKYRYPRVRQRPILLIGPPGIGKTAIMEQVAGECGVGLVAYTITHHTRQSAIGLPHIEQRTYAGHELTVTEYTMSEIIASVYACMEETGHEEGILFIDEINCVSETLAPTMLQFLQNKTFGNHRVPEGWLIVAAGNPPQYNKSVREFDVATLDRVRRIQIDVDLNIWLDYAGKKEIHPAIVSYLSIYKEHFYIVENTADGKSFVTARGWEDLSELIRSYEELAIPVTPELVEEYLQKEAIARNFAAYYQLYQKYGRDYAIGELLDSNCPATIWQDRVAMARKAGFDERITIEELLLDALHNDFRSFAQEEKVLEALHQKLGMLKRLLSNVQSDRSVHFAKAGAAIPSQSGSDIACTAQPMEHGSGRDNSNETETQTEADIQKLMEEFLVSQKNQLGIKVSKDLISYAEVDLEEQVLMILTEYLHLLKGLYLHDIEESFEKIKEAFGSRVAMRRETAKELVQRIDRAFAFTEDAFGDGQEMVLLVSNLARGELSRSFLTEQECDAFLTYSKKLLYREREKELQEACRSFLLKDADE